MWLERPGAPGPLDEVLLERLAIAAAAVVERYGPARTTMADPALVELAISADSDQVARARALRLLGFAADLPVHVAAVRSQRPLDQVGGLVCPARPVKAAPLASVGVILTTTLDLARFPDPVQTLLPDRPHPPLREGVRIRRLDRRLDGLDAVAGEDIVEGTSEPAVAITNQDPRCAGFPLSAPVPGASTALVLAGPPRARSDGR